MGAYTVVRVDGSGVFLRRFHAQRLALGGAATLEAFERFCANATPGIYALRENGDALDVTQRPASRLWDGIPARLVVSPVATQHPERFPKPAPPCVYDGVRKDGVASILTTANGEEILEGCVASVVGWDNGQWVLVPAARPRVWSVAEAALRETLPFVERPLRSADETPLLLVNAVKGVCTVELAGRAKAPRDAVGQLEDALRRAR